MKYALAVLCPPYALWDCGNSWQAAFGLIFLASAISLGNVGVVIALLFLETLWALGMVGRRDAHREAQEFARAVRLHEAARRY
jgi:hypothetical protein